MLNDRLFDLLQALDSEELDRTWSLLGRSAADDELDRRTRDQKIEPVSRELRRVAGHAISDWIHSRRAHDLPWDAILRRLADRLDLSVPASADAAALETALLDRLAEEIDAQARVAPARPLPEAAAAAVAAITALASRGRHGRPARLLLAIATARPLWGPRFEWLVPAALFVISAARTHEALAAMERTA